MNHVLSFFVGAGLGLIFARVLLWLVERVGDLVSGWRWRRQLRRLHEQDGGGQ